jgi:hypothetical protein
VLKTSFETFCTSDFVAHPDEELERRERDERYEDFFSEKSSRNTRDAITNTTTRCRA